MWAGSIWEFWPIIVRGHLVSSFVQYNVHPSSETVPSSSGQGSQDVVMSNSNNTSEDSESRNGEEGRERLKSRVQSPRRV